MASISIAFLLLGILALPNVNQWIHLLEEHHSEQHCTENNLHFHTSERTCELNATFVSPYTPGDVLASKLHEEVRFYPRPFKLLLGYSFNHDYAFYLRGPPQLLFSV